jgi:hypothetical protein
VVDYITDSDEASKVLVFEGKLHLDSYNESEVTYQAYGDDYETTITGARTYNDTLVNIFTTYCGASYLNLTLDSSNARSPSPDVYWSTSGERVLVEDLSDMAAFWSHSFYIKNGTLYLVDQKGLNGTGTITTFDHFKGYQVETQPPVSLFIADGEDFTGAHEYGQEFNVSPVCATGTTDIQTALSHISVNVQYSYFRVRATPEAGNIFNIGDLITVWQDSFMVDGQAQFRVTDMAIDIAREEILIEGCGVDYAT